MKFEACASSCSSALAAQEGGAARVELCDNLYEGGTTPSYAQISLCRSKLHIKLYPIIRPRGGDFLYSDLEFELMKEDIKNCRSLNCDGVVFGILRPDGTVDEARNAELLELAKPMGATFHRAFDMVNDMPAALETIIRLGFERVLTSGGAANAIEGADVIKKLIEQANGRIIIMPGAGITENNLAGLIEKTGATEYHGSAKASIPSKMTFRNADSKLGGAADEYQYEETSALRVKALTTILNQYNTSV